VRLQWPDGNGNDSTPEMDIVRVPTTLTALLVLNVALLGGCGGSPERGSQVDLTRHIDALEVPDSMVKIQDHFTAKCEGACPSLVRWYDVPGPTDAARSTLISQFSSAGMEPQWSELQPDLMRSTKDGYVYLSVFNGPRHWPSSTVPTNVDAEIIVSPLKTAN
jgi:hypothetical protein